MNTKAATMIWIVFCFFFASCDQESKSAISNYSGDGSIRHLSSPGVFGIDGIEVRFQEFDLSQNYNAQYSLRGLPEGKPYMLYLVVPDPAPLDRIKKNHLRVRILSDDRVIREMSQPIGGMINNQQHGLNRFYCLEGTKDMVVSTQVDAHAEEDCSIEVYYENINVHESFFGYFVLERGGFK